MSTKTDVEDLLREYAPRVVGALVRRYGNFDLAEDAAQEALLAASVQWTDDSGDGVPDNPLGWLLTVGARRLTDQLRSESARRRRETTAAAMALPGDFVAPAPDEVDQSGRTGAGDDTLTLLFLCCHPALTPASRIALTLRAVGGLTTAEIAGAFLVPETTMGQRISRAKQRVKAAGARFVLPPESERAERLGEVLQVLYLIFNEGYTTTAGPDLVRTDLTGEAIRLARALHRLLPDDGEVAGLLALMLLTEARGPARVRLDGSLVPLAEQDRGQWRADLIAEGVELITATLAFAPVGPYQLQAAIAAIHDEAERPEDTDWPQILLLYELLLRIAPNPMTALNHAVAVAMVRGPRAGLELLAELDTDDRLAEHHRLDAVRAHLLELDGELATARETYLRAAGRTTSGPERDYLESRAARLDPADSSASGG